MEFSFCTLPARSELKSKLAWSEPARCRSESESGNGSYLFELGICLLLAAARVVCTGFRLLLQGVVIVRLRRPCRGLWLPPSPVMRKDIGLLHAICERTPSRLRCGGNINNLDLKVKILFNIFIYLFIMFIEMIDFLFSFQFGNVAQVAIIFSQIWRYSIL
jgi:hypothetical protein